MSENAYHFDIMNSIPCEFCQILIDLQDYEEHARECVRRRDPFFNFYNSLPNLIDRIAQNLQNTAEGDPDYEEAGDGTEYETDEGISQEVETGEEQIEGNIQPFDANDTHYEFFNDQQVSHNIGNPPFQETSLNSIFMQIPNSLSSMISDNIQTFLSNPLPVFMNSNPLHEDDGNPLISFEQLLEQRLSGDQTAQNYNEFMNLAERIGTVKIGLTEEIIKEKFRVVEKTDICCICTEEKNNFLVSPCKHELCEYCTMEWFKENKKCAHCQVEIE